MIISALALSLDAKRRYTGSAKDRSRVPEGSMRAQMITAILITAAAATLGFALVSADAAPEKKKETDAQAVAPNRPAAKVTVRKRSYLDPGTETKPGSERYMDYAFPPPSPSHLNGPGDSRVDFTRMPFPNCFDLAGFCR
jgi:hypothetical protein